MGANHLTEKRLTKRLETFIMMLVKCSSSFLPSFHAQPCMEGLFLTPVLTTSHDGKGVKIANLGIAYFG